MQFIVNCCCGLDIINVSVFQIEKVLQQGEISDCVDPYVTLRECDSGKVMNAEQTVKLFTNKCSPVYLLASY